MIKTKFFILTTNLVGGKNYSLVRLFSSFDAGDNEEDEEDPDDFVVYSRAV